MRTLAVGLLTMVVVGIATVGRVGAADRPSLIGELIFDPSVTVSEVPQLAGRRTTTVTGLVINPIFDTSITNDPNAATIMSTINAAIAVYEASFSDPITVSIKFRKMSGGLGLSQTYVAYPAIFSLTYSNYLAHLSTHATTADDATALAHLPPGPNNPVNGNPNMSAKLANLRALGFGANPPPGQPDSTISLHTAICNLDRSLPNRNRCRYDLMAVVSHEIDEALGLGSALPAVLHAGPLNGLVFPEDLFRYEQVNTRSFNTTSTSQAFFSIDGATQLAQFNQNSGGDFGDWLSLGPHTPQVQDAFGSQGATPDLGVELTALDVVGYSLIAPPPPAPTPTPTTPENTGFIPPEPFFTGKCEDMVARHLAAFAGCVTKCQIKQADSRLAGTTFDEEACENGTGSPTSCRTAYTNKTAALLAHVPPLCPPCLDLTAQNNLADLVTNFLDSNNGQIYCAGSTNLGDDDTGFVPPDANTAKCEDTVAKHLRTLAACVITRCHIKQADAAVYGKCFDEEWCESGTGKPVSCRAAYDKTTAALLAHVPPLCPPCLDLTAQNNLADLVTTFLDNNNGQIYCAGTVRLPP